MKSNEEWRYWGKRDPLWSVAAWPGKQVGGNSPWTPELFLALGESDFRDIFRHWNHYGLSAGTCVEIGCGAGRMTAQLVSIFRSVVALDVSPDQIALARRLLGPRADAVQFYQVDGPTIPLPTVTCDAMFSCHVFQHFSQFAGVAEYLRESFRVLRSGGTVCFHIPVPGAHRGAAVSRVRLALHNASVTVRRWLGRRRIMEYHRYAPPMIFETLRAIGYRDVELRLFDMTSNGDAHSFFFARRP
jgi:SAM-dependent methyltransferase